MWNVYRRCYSGTRQDLFEQDLSGKQTLILLRDAQQRIQGFSTIAVGSARHEGRDIRYLFSGDTVIEREHWGSQELAFSWLRFAGSIQREDPGLPLFWFLIVKGHRTYRYLPAFALAFYPNWQHETPLPLATLMRHLARERFGDAFDEASGIVRFADSRGHLSKAVAEPSEREAVRADVRFFLDRNPGYREGDELVCLCELSPDNLRPLARRLFVGGQRT